MNIYIFYRPQRSWAKVMFLQASVILLTGGMSASVHAGIPHPQEGGTPPPQGRRHSPRKEAPPTLPPSPKETPPEGDPPGIRSMSGRYASYWNAFFYILDSMHSFPNTLCLPYQCQTQCNLPSFSSAHRLVNFTFAVFCMQPMHGSNSYKKYIKIY